jgi:hypothetical protein
VITGLQPVLRVVNSDGTLGRALNGWTKITLGGDEGEARVLKVDYNAQDPTYARLDDQVTVVVLLGGVEYQDMRFRLDESNTDEVEDQDTATWAGQSLLAGYLDNAIVYPPDFPATDPPGKQLANETPGRTVGALVTAAKARGCFPALTLGFTDNLDSAGVAWGVTSSEFLDQGTSYYDVVKKWAERRYAVARMNGNQLQLFTYGRHGADLTQVVILRRGYELDEGPVNSSTRDVRSAMLAVAPELGAIERTDASALSTYGRREAYLSQTQVPDGATLGTIADSTLALKARSRDSFTYGLLFGEKTRALPFKHYAQGDIVTLRVRGAERQLRLRSLSVVWDQNGAVTGSIGLGAKYRTPEEAATELIERLTANSSDEGLYNTPAVAGTGTPTTGDVDPADPGGYDAVPPAAVTGLAMTNVFYNASKVGQQQILATFQWNPVVTNLDGSAINDLAYYQVEWYDPVWWGDIDPAHRGDYYVPTATTPSDKTVRTVEFPLVGRTYHVRIRAVDFWGNAGAWTEGDFPVTGPTLPPDAPPSTPVVEPVLFGALQVTWDGLETGGAALDDDIRSAVVHVSTSTGFTPTLATVVGEIPRPAAGSSGITVITDLTPGTTYYVKLQLKDVWGTLSPASAQATGVPADVSFSGAVGPESLTFDDFGNLVPDGGFERAEFRSALVSQVSSDGAVTWVNDASLSFPHNTGAHVLLDVASTATGQWLARGGSIAPTGVDADGVYKDSGSNAPRWGSSTDVPFDSTKLYRISARMRVDREATNAPVPKSAYLMVESKTATQFMSVNGTNDATLMQAPGANGRTMLQSDGWRTWTGYFKGTAATPMAPGLLAEGTVEAPVPLPAGTTKMGIQVAMDWASGNGKWHVGRAQITTIPVSFEGEWSAQLVGAGAGKFQRVVLATIPSGGGTEQYYIRFRARVVGALTTQPTVFAGVRILTADGSQVAVTPLPQRAAWTNDGWVTIEGRVSRLPDAQFETARSAEIYVGTYDLRATQQVQFDAVEVRQVATSVLIADAAITDAKIQSLSASKITAGTISAAVTVSGEIATALTGARVTLNSSGLKAYDGVGQTVGINSDGTAFFSGSLGNTDVAGYVRALSGAKQAVLYPLGGALFSGSAITYPGMLFSPGYVFEQAQGFLGEGGVSSQPYGAFKNVWTTSTARSYQQTNGARLAVIATMQDFEPFPILANTFYYPRGSLEVQFPVPAARIPIRNLTGESAIGTGGGSLSLVNHWGYLWPPDYSVQDQHAITTKNNNARVPGDEVVLVGLTKTGQEAGIVFRTANSAQPGGITIDFRRSYGENPSDVTGPAIPTGTFPATQNAGFCEIRVQKLWRIDAEGIMSDRRIKERISEVPFSALDVIRENPAQKWYFKPERQATDVPHIGPMANDLPEELTEVDPDSGMTMIRHDDMTGLLWKAAGELLARIEELENR